MEKLYNASCIIILYSFLGWCTEVLYAALKSGKFVNRGFLNGPVCPIYGFGVLLVLTVLKPVKDNLLLLFFGSVLLTSALEFIIGFILERFFKDKWWDYSENPFNIKGYVCLEFSMIWGIACVLVVDVLHPVLIKPISKIPYDIGVWITGILSAIMMTDMTITLVELLKLPKLFRAMDSIEEKLREVSDTIGEKALYSGYERGKENIERFNEKHGELCRMEKLTLRSLTERRNELNKALKEAEQNHSGRFVRRRIAKAFPQLLNGTHHGRHFEHIFRNNK